MTGHGKKKLLSRYRMKVKFGTKSGGKTLNKRKVWWEKNGKSTTAPSY